MCFPSGVRRFIAEESELKNDFCAAKQFVEADMNVYIWFTLAKKSRI
jgi:hypothetical protein